MGIRYVEIDGVKYSLNENTMEASVISKSPIYTGDIVIPSSVNYSDVTYSVTSIGSAFGSCKGLTSVEIPSSVTSIGSSAFYNCTGLTSIEIPNSVISIGESAFYGCTGLASIEIPNSVTIIGDNAFHNTEWYYNQPDGLLYAGRVVYKYKGTMPENTSIAIKDGTTRILSSAFSGCTGLTSIKIPNSVTTIGNIAFKNCTRLTSVELGNGVTSICEGAFSGCSSLASITIPNSVTSIDKGAFMNCFCLTSIDIPNSVTFIGSGVFSGCTELTMITINSNTIVSHNYEHSGQYQIWSGLGKIFGNQVKRYILGNDVTAIGEWAFDGCSGITSIEISNSVTEIGGGAFYGCTGLTSVKIPGSVKNINNQAFNNCSNLAEVLISDGVTTIGWSTFRNCSKIRSITFPESILSVGPYSFCDCTNLSRVAYLNSTTPGAITSFPTFENVSPQCVLYIPIGTTYLYAERGWTNNVFGGGVIEIDTTGLQTAMASTTDDFRDIYSINGTYIGRYSNINVLPKGKYIVKYGNGKTEKVFVR